MLSEILNEVQTGQKRHLPAPATPRLEPMMRKKRRKTMVNLPNVKKCEQLTNDDISLRYITNGIMKKKAKQMQTDEEGQEETQMKTSPTGDKENKSHAILERITTTPKRHLQSPKLRRHSLGPLSLCRTSRLSFDGLFRQIKKTPKPTHVTFTAPRVMANKPQVKDFYEIFKRASSQTKD